MSAGLERAVQVLNLLSERPDGVPFNELCRECGSVVPTTMSRLLKAMLASELARKDGTSGYYRLGAGFIALSRKALGVQSRAEIVAPGLKALAEATGESAAFFGLDGAGMTLLAKFEKEDSFHYESMGKHFRPLPNDPFGWACSAFDKKLRLEARADASALRKLRTEGCLAQQRNIRGQILRVVAPVFLRDSARMAGSIGITAIYRPGIAREAKRLKSEVKAAAENLSARLVS